MTFGIKHGNIIKFNKIFKKSHKKLHPLSAPLGENFIQNICISFHSFLLHIDATITELFSSNKLKFTIITHLEYHKHH